MKVKYKDNVIELNEDKKVIDILNDECNLDVIACKCNNEIKPLDFIIKEDTNIELIDISDPDGMRIYIRGVLYVMSKAVSNLYPEEEIIVNYQLSNSMFCELTKIEITDEMIKNIRKEMQRIIDENLKITKVTMSKQDAEEFYKNENTLKGKLQLYAQDRDYVSLYFCEKYFNYFFGVMPISTSYIKVYDILKYKNGFLVRYPSKKNIHKLSKFIDNEKLLAALEDYEKIHELLEINTVYRLNKRIQEGKSKEIVLLDEALHEKKISRIADEIARNNDKKMILIAGPSSSGKTTFAQRLGIQLELNGLKPVMISVDNYFVEREQNPKDENGNYDFECIEAIDLELFNNHILKLLNGETVEIPTFNFQIGKKEYNGDFLKLGKEDVLVIEGIHCLNDKLTSQIPKNKKYKIYISALTVLNIDYYNRISTTDSRLIRRIVRDNQFRGYSALHTLKMWNSVNEGERKNIFPYQEEADVMFNTSLVYELSVLKDYAIPLLKQIDNTVPEYSEAKRLYKFLQYFETIPSDIIPTNSLVREFIGGGDFKQ